MKKTWLKTLLKIAGSALIIWLLVSRINWNLEEFKRILAGLDLAWFLFSLFGVVIVLGIKSIRWNILLKQEDCSYSRWRSFIAYMASFTIGLVTPGRVGEIARLYYVREDTGITFYRSFKTLVADRIFDFALLIWFGGTGMLYFYKLLGNFSGFVYLLATAFAMMMVWGAGYWFLKILVKPESSPVSFRFIMETWNGMFKPAMFIPWLLTLLAYFLFYLANQMILKAVGIELNIIDISFILSLMSLVTIIPITLAGFGTREASLVYLLSFYLVSPETAIVFSLLQFTAFFLWGGIIGLLIWFYKPVSINLIMADYKAFIRYLKGDKQ
ncbi:MAG: flippase-like domain-containing protein [Bacteroidales bacterium]|nr:flippase-like domain-containing protein [Bacteroidales bacterium]